MTGDEHHGSADTDQTARRKSQDSAITTQDIGARGPFSTPLREAFSAASSQLSPRSIEAPSFHSAVSFGSDGNVQVDSRGRHELGALGVRTEELDHGERGAFVVPSLSIDTKDSQKKPHGEVLQNSQCPLVVEQPDTSASIFAGSTSIKSPTSPRNRGRGFSLRRSLLARSVHGQPESSESIIELQPANSSASPTSTAKLSNHGTTSKKSATNIVVSPINDQANDSDENFKFTNKSNASTSLPNYERWLAANQVARIKYLASFKVVAERIRKKILRIEEKPSSKDGRHVVPSVAHKKRLIDDRTGHEYIDNTILSTRYSLYNFLPRQLFAQFSKLANFYFLCVSILQMIPGLSTTGTYTTIVPLLFFVTISIAKEGYDDLRRYRLDKTENNRSALVLRGSKSGAASSPEDFSPVFTDGAGPWKKTKWCEVRVGDCVKLNRDDAVPADVVVLQAKGTDGMAYIETMALDGETNLKSKRPSTALTANCRTIGDMLRCNPQFVVEDPNLNLYNFEGKLSIGDEVSPLTNNEIIYRGSVIRNTPEVIGVVVYTGEECKIRMNATKNPRIKAPALQAVVNKVVIILVVFVVALAIFNTVAYQVWKGNVEGDPWYLADAGVAFFPIFVSFIILFNTMIPLSLYVSLEIVKLFQMFLMNDIEMYDETTNTPMEARTSTINEDLGQVNYIFSDKTGTLTNNSMRFRKLSICGTSWLHDLDLQEDAIIKDSRGSTAHRRHSKGKKAVWRNTSDTEPHRMSRGSASNPYTPISPIVCNSSAPPDWSSPGRRAMHGPELRTSELLKYVQGRPYTVFARKTRQLLLSMALCHTCYPERTAKGKIEYQATSPDEQALVRAAHDLGFILCDKQNATVSIETEPLGGVGATNSEVYQILDVIEFSSDRKRMSIIVRMPDLRICIFCKGADSVLTRLLRQSDLAISKAVEVEERAIQRQSIEAQVAIRRQSESKSRKNSVNRKSFGISRPSLGGVSRPSMTANRLQPIRDEVNGWLAERETDINFSERDNESVFYSPRPSGHHGVNQPGTSIEGRPSIQADEDELVDEALVVDDQAVFGRCFQHINDFATEGLRTLLYGYKYIDEDEYKDWKKIYLDASTSLTNRQEMIEKAGAIIERDFELAGATAIEDLLQDGVPEAIDKLRRANIKLWMLTGDKRETAINIGHSCRLVKDYSTVTILDQEVGDVGQRIAAATLQLSNGAVAHAVIVVDGHTLSYITASLPLRELFLSLATEVDTVICCRAAPAQKAFLVSSIRHRVKNAVTLAIGDGANDIAMITEAQCGIGITGKEGLQAARTSDYSIAQFRFLTKLLLVHGRWNYIRTCKYTLGTFWKEMLFYLTQALYQRYAGYTGTSLYESWSLSMFNTLFTSLPVIFMGVFEQDVRASTLLAVPDLYHSLGHCNGGFSIKRYLAWVTMAASQAVIVFFIMLGLYGQALFTDNGLYAMGDLTFTACIVVIATKMQFWELQNKTYTCAISMFISIGGWFLWNIILSQTYSNNVIYNVKDGFFDRFGRSPTWWLTLILIVTACWAVEIGVKTIKASYFPSDADVFRELEKDPVIRRRFEEAAAIGLTANASSGAPNGNDIRAGSDLHPLRTASEDKEREREVQEMLNRPRHSRGTSGASHEVEIERPSQHLRRRQHSDTEARSPQEHKVSFAVADRVMGGDDDDDDEDDEDTNRKDKLRRRSTDVPELLRRKFGSIRRSLDIV